MARILVVDDEKVMVKGIRFNLENEGYTVDVGYNGRQAVELASLDKFIASLDDGLDHEVGQFGANLSGGQRQKIAIAGAILSQAKLLILDEPTASLDIISTNEILHTVSQLKGSRTVVLITHDREAVRAADHVIVAEGDSKFCEGSPDQVGVMSEFFCKLMEGGQMQE